jgi:hypothetical protein
MCDRHFTLIVFTCSGYGKIRATRSFLLFFILFMLFLTGLLYGMGEPEIRLPIPADALIAGEVDCKTVLDTEIGLTLMTILSTGVSTGNITKKARETLDARLEILWGLKSEHIERITWCILSVHPGMSSPDYGVVFSLNSITPRKILDTLTIRLSLKKMTSGNVVYYMGHYEGTPLYLTFNEKEIVVTSSREGMTKMIDAVQGKNDITRNTKLYPLIKQYRETPLYCTGIMTEEIADIVPHPFNKIKYFVLTMNTADSLTISLMEKAHSPDIAQKIVTMTGGYIQLITTLIMAEDKEAGRVAGELLGRITVEAKGSDVTAYSVYTAEDIEKAIGLMFLFSLRGMDFIDN